ncbi:unnamed protein product [Caenorhabditis bovis]|uniref:7TM GPCR serpentine receptor class x (Srx) domain-containing protein n=1 Tax=Caenorhabditis bovis TaxID=2654633 RepID=A0A8S1E6G3_9PELO|nr:unnamed protein product [Caenorhabditis bovis]
MRSDILISFIDGTRQSSEAFHQNEQYGKFMTPMTGRTLRIKNTNYRSGAYYVQYFVRELYDILIIKLLLFSKMAVNAWGGYILLVVSPIGTISNFAVIILCYRLQFFKNSFGYLTANQALGAALLNSGYLFYIVPTMIFNIEIFETCSHHFCYAILIGYELSTQSHFLISLNRFLACYTPMAYDTIFSTFATKIIIILTWTYAIGVCTLFYIILDCRIFFNPRDGFFYYLETPTCDFISWYADFCKFALLVVLIIVMDICTVLKIRSLNKKIGQAVLNREAIKKRKRDMNYLKQTVFQGMAFAFDLAAFFIISPFVEDQNVRFLMTTFTWSFIHTIDG